MWMSVGSFNQPINGRCPGVPSGRLGVVCCGVPCLLGLSLFFAMICFLLEGLLPMFLSVNVVAKVVASVDVSSVASADVYVLVTLSFVSPAVRLPDVLLRMKWHMDIECSWQNEGDLCEFPSILHANSPSRCP